MAKQTQVKFNILKLAGKDLCVYKAHIALLAIIFFVITSLFLVLENKINLLLELVLLAVANDMVQRLEDQQKTESLICSLPLRRSELVWARFGQSFFFLALATAMILLSVFALKTLLPDYFPFSMAPINTLSLCLAFYVYALYIAINHYLYFRFGYAGYPQGLLKNLAVSAAVIAVAIASLWLLNFLVAKSRGLPWTGSHTGSGSIISFGKAILGRALELFGEKSLLAMLGLVTAALVAASLFLSLRHFTWGFPAKKENKLARH